MAKIFRRKGSKKMKKILCVIPGIENTGGAERVMTVLCNGFAEDGIETILVVQEPGRPAYDLDENVHYCNTGTKCRIPGLRPLVRNWGLRSLIKQERPDIILSFLYKMNILTILFTRGLKIPVVVSERINPAVLAGTLWDKVRNHAYRYADGIVFQTKEAKNYFSHKIQNKSTIIRNPLTGGIPQKRNYDTGYRIAAVGRLTRQKNFTLLIYVFAEFIKEYPLYCLDIFGEGCLREELQEQIKELGLEGKVILHGRREDVLEQIVKADFYVMTSDYEGLPNALAEAMAVGLPCISTACEGGGAEALIENGKNGILVKRNASEELLAEMKRFAGNKELRRRIGEEARHLKRELDRRYIVKQWEEFLEQIRGK